MDDEKIIDPRYIERLRSLPKSNHDDKQDAMSQVMAGQAVFHPDSPFVSIEARSHVNTKPEIPHVDITHRQDIFQPTKSVLDAIDEDIDRQLTAFGNVNGFPVIFVMFEKSMERKDGKTTCGFELRMFKADQMSEAASFAKSCAGELGVYGAEGSHQESARQHKDDIDIRLDNVSYRSEFMQAPIIDKDKDCIKPVVPYSICAPGYESGLSARSSANSSGGEFWINSKRSKDEIIDDLIKKVKRLEDERDYWKREAEGKNGDDDTLGIFRHWDD